jgi:hypothetical protein
MADAQATTPDPDGKPSTDAGEGKASEAGTAGEARDAAKDGPDTDVDRWHAFDENAARKTQREQPDPER